GRTGAAGGARAARRREPGRAARAGDRRASGRGTSAAYAVAGPRCRADLPPAPRCRPAARDRRTGLGPYGWTRPGRRSAGPALRRPRGSGTGRAREPAVIAVPVRTRRRLRRIAGSSSPADRVAGHPRALSAGLAIGAGAGAGVLGGPVAAV